MTESEKYNLMEISSEKLDQISYDKVGPGVHVAILYGMPVILKCIGKNNEETQVIVSDLSKYNHPSLALNYGFNIDKKSENYQKTDKVYIVRELVKGKNFHNIGNYHIHDKLVLLYKLICLLEFLHSFDVYYLFLHPTKIIITDDLEIKVIDHIKVNEDKLANIKIQSLNDETRFISPDLFKKVDYSDKDLLNKIDLYTFGCLLFYSTTGELPWMKIENKDDIIKAWQQSKKCLFLESVEHYTEDIIKVYHIIEKLLHYKYTSTEQVRLDFEKIPEVKDYLTNGTLMFDFEEESLKIIENIEELVREIDKLYDDNNLPRHFNTIHQPNTKFMYSDSYEVDNTKHGKGSLFGNLDKKNKKKEKFESDNQVEFELEKNK